MNRSELDLCPLSSFMLPYLASGESVRAGSVEGSSPVPPAPAPVASPAPAPAQDDDRADVAAEIMEELLDYFEEEVLDELF